MTTAPEELEARISARASEASRNRRKATIVENLGVRRTLWLAAPPMWTRSAAVKAGFPAEPESVTDFVRRARAVGWCESRGSLDADGPTELSFWMPDEVRREVLGLMPELIDGGLPGVQSDAKEVAARVVSQVVPRAGEVDLPGALRAWAELLVQAEPDDVSARLIESVRHAVDCEELSRAREFVIAAKALEPVLAGTADRDLDRARRMLDGGLDRREEERRLGCYLDRPELSGAVDRLLAPWTDKWALHLRGVGGVGKTTLIRYLTSGRYAEDRQLSPIPMACVNFDRISPDYPVRKPMQLLVELADGLTPYTAASHPAHEALRAFRDNARWANKGASWQPEDGTRLLENDDVRDAVDAFADMVNRLGRVLLILDTCEELAKWGAGSPDSPAIVATLDIVERLHEQASSVRVLFAGRRRLPVRGWLDERDVVGFTVDEARRYLAQFAKRTLRGDLAEEMIRQSRAIENAERVNPFDLALYRAWADEEPHLSLEEVRRGSDAYVESRIIKRLGDKAVTGSLPMLAVGGKCRIAAMAAVLGCEEAELRQGLLAQEWIDAAGGMEQEDAEGGISPEFVTAWPAMAGKLRRYYHEAERQGEFSRVARRFARELLSRLGDALADPADAEIDFDEVLTALRLAKPAKAAPLWDKIAEWATGEQGRWATVGNATTRILGEWEDAEWPTTDALRASVLAAAIANDRRRMPQADLSEQWRQVLGAADGHPQAVRRQQLRILGALGALPYAPQDASLWEVITADRDGLLGVPEVGTATIDALHRLLEAGHADAAARLRELLDLDSFRFGFAEQSEVSRALAWANVADARLVADHDPRVAQDRLARAERLASEAASPEPAWPHWIPPADLLARVRLERGLIAPPSDLATVAEWEDHAAQNLSSIDAERLASLCLRLRLQRGVLSAGMAERWEWLDGYQPGWVVTNSAHKLVPPLFASVAQAWLSAGRPERALALLERRRSEANDAGADDATVRCANAAIVAIARRLRLTDRRSLLAGLADPAAYQSADARTWTGILDDARRAWAVIYRTRPPKLTAGLDRLASWHAWWQCQPGGVPAVVPPVPWPPDGWSPQRPDAEITDRAGLSDILADLEEMSLLGRDDLADVRGQLEDRLAGQAPAPRPAQVAPRCADPFHDLRVSLRSAVPDRMRYAPPYGTPRVVAEAAFGEAELLALRLPDRAARIFWVAQDAYATCGDHIGRLLALAAFHDVLSACPADDQAVVLAGLGPRVSTAQDALLDELGPVRRDHPALAAILTDGPPEDAGLWRYWAQTIQRLIKSPAEAGQGGAGGHAEEPAPAATTRAVGRAAAVLRALLGVLALPLAALAAGGIRAAFRLADERGAGVARPEFLRFVVTIGQAAAGDRDDTLRLWVRLRPWQSAPARAWSRPRLRAVILAVRLVRFGWPGRPTGYSGVPVTADERPDPGTITWTPPLPPPGGTWWGHQGDAGVAGTIGTSRDQAARPWERILARSLGPAAVGRVEWVRVPPGQVRPVHQGAVGADLIAPRAWDRLLGRHYRTPAASAGPVGSEPAQPRRETARSANTPVRVKHVIGRAVRTSAGAYMDVSGAGSGTTRGGTLLSATELIRGHPLVVLLQAEPANDEEAGTVRQHDVADKLRLATALMDDGVPGVLVLPELPARLASEVASIVATFAGTPGLSGEDIQAGLLRPLRRVIAHHGEPAMLDDIITFLNARYS